METNQIYQIDAFEGLAQLEDNSIDCVVTSPPYWQARSYGNESKTALGAEVSPYEYVEKFRPLFREILRVLKPFGTFCFNIGDIRSQGKRRQRGRRDTSEETRGKNFKGWTNWDGELKFIGVDVDIPAKSYLGIPERILLNALDDGWTVRDKIIWGKGVLFWDGTTRGGTTPSPINDRFQSNWEYLFYFTKTKNNYFNRYAIEVEKIVETGYKIPPNVWIISPRVGKEPSYPQDLQVNFATYPKTLSDLCVRSVCPPKVCVKCGNPIPMLPNYSRFKGCTCWGDNDIPQTKPGVVLDPFAGFGTTAISAIDYGVNYIGFDILKPQVDAAKIRVERYLDYLKN